MSEVRHTGHTESLGEGFIERRVEGEGREEETRWPLQNSKKRVGMGGACFLKELLHLCTDLCTA